VKRGNALHRSDESSSELAPQSSPKTFARIARGCPKRSHVLHLRARDGCDCRPGERRELDVNAKGRHLVSNPKAVSPCNLIRHLSLLISTIQRRRYEAGWDSHDKIESIRVSLTRIPCLNFVESFLAVAPSRGVSVAFYHPARLITFGC
jgi:hypothetical protein